jgi:hypothetical protein
MQFYLLWDALLDVDSKGTFLSYIVQFGEIFDAFLPIPDGAVAGAAAGVVVETALYPIDTVKTRLQVTKIVVYIFKDCSEN